MGERGARSWAEIDLGAIRRNVETLRALSAPAQLCAVVKAGGYGHGAVPAAEAALAGGAAVLGVAQVSEAAELRAAGIDAPVLLLSEPLPDQVTDAVAHGLDVAAYRAETIAALSAVADPAQPVPVHLKIDTGMHRVGAAPGDAAALARSIVEAPGLELAAVWTHCAVADEPDDPYTGQQLERFHAVLDQLAARGISPRLRHAANSAGAICHPDARLDLVRCGIAIYGVPPAPRLDGAAELEPALRWASEVSFVKTLAAGERVSYGLRHTIERDTVVATLPVGYADGVRRDLGLLHQEVLVGGQRHPIIGVVTMDQLLVDVGPGSDVAVGDEAVLLGAQGAERVSPDEWASRTGSIGYEVVCAIGARVERRYVET